MDKTFKPKIKKLGAAENGLQNADPENSAGSLILMT